MRMFPRRVAAAVLTVACGMSLSVTPAMAADQAAVDKAIRYLKQEKAKSYFSLLYCDSYQARVDELIGKASELGVEGLADVKTPLSSNELELVEEADKADRIDAIEKASDRAHVKPVTLSDAQKEQFDGEYNKARHDIERALRWCGLVDG